ncbi:MAG: hypothetical protein VX278_23260 [Myxococcota bacterium]|nr:hypothetical protein [Myxococcota bacterium]
MVFLLLAIACIQEPCEQLCTDISNKLDECLVDWPADWSDFDVVRKEYFQQRCLNLWAVERSQLEARELDDAYEQCTEAVLYFDSNTETCDHLRATYLADPFY